MQKVHWNKIKLTHQLSVCIQIQNFSQYFQNKILFNIPSRYFFTIDYKIIF